MNFLLFTQRAGPRFPAHEPHSAGPQWCWGQEPLVLPFRGKTPTNDFFNVGRLGASPTKYVPPRPKPLVTRLKHKQTLQKSSTPRIVFFVHALEKLGECGTPQNAKNARTQRRNAKTQHENARTPERQNGTQERQNGTPGIPATQARTPGIPRGPVLDTLRRIFTSSRKSEKAGGS